MRFNKSGPQLSVSDELFTLICLKTVASKGADSLTSTRSNSGDLLLGLIPTGRLKLYPNMFTIKTCYSLFVNVKSHLVSQWLLTWTSLFTRGGALVGEPILLGLIYDTQMFRVSSYPVGGGCVCVYVHVMELF